MITINIQNTHCSKSQILFIDFKQYLEHYNTMFNDTNLLNIRDKLLTDVNKTLFI
jgi:hypothetical protein